MAAALVMDEFWEVIGPLLPEHRPTAGGRLGRDRVRAEVRDLVAGGPLGTRLRVRDDAPSPAGGVAGRRRLVRPARRPAREAERGGQARLVPGGGRLGAGEGPARRQKTGPNPADRAKRGSKNTLLTDGNGVPLACTLTGPNRHDVTELLPAVDAVPPVRGRRGRPRRRPRAMLADRAYDSEPHRRELRRRGIRPRIARRKTPHGSGLGKARWVVERTISWLHRFRRLGTRYERDDGLHEPTTIPASSHA